MSLDALVTPDRLRALAGYAFARGDGYYREGRVEHCEVQGNTLLGLVVGTHEYAVRITAHASGLAAECTCPMGHGFCKHAVAVALHWREHGGKPVEAEPAPRPEDLFSTPDEVVRWADEHQVGHALAAAADKVIGELRDPLLARGAVGYTLARVPLGSVASRAAAKRLVDGVPGDRIAAAAKRVLAAEAASVADGLVEEKARGAGPTEGAPAVLWARLSELRRELRKRAVPRGRTARLPSGLQFEREAVAVVWFDRDRLPGASRGVAVRLTCPSGGVPVVFCGCGTRDGACVHGLALVDSLLDLLGDPGRRVEANEVAEELVRPGWSRALAALAERAAADAEPRAAFEVWWEVEPELDRLNVSPVVKRQTKRGALTAGARIPVARLLDEYGDRLTEHDRRIAEHAAAWVPGRTPATYPVRAFLALAGHPRVTLAGDADPLAVRREALGFTAISSGSALRLVPAVGGERFDPRLLAALLETFRAGEPLVDLDDREGRTTCRLIDVGPDARLLATLLATHGDEFPPESHGELFERLAALEAKLPVEVPDSLKGTELVGEAGVVVRVRFIGDTTLELEAFVRPARGTPLFTPGAGPRDVLVARDGERGYVRRKLGDEPAQVRGMLARIPLETAVEGPPLCFEVRDDAALALVLALEAPPPGLEAEWIETRPRVQRALGPSALRVQIDSKRDWFGIDGDAKVETGRLELAVLLDAARRQRRFVRIGEHRWAELSELLRERLTAIADQTFAAKDHLEVSPGAVPAVRALADAGADVEVAPRWRLLGERLAAAEKLRPRPSKALAATLRDYQVEGHAWLSRLAAWGAGACLADDMGLGKTVQAISVLVDRAKLGPALVIAPTSVVFNWASELARFAPELRVVHYGADADRAATLAKLGPRDVVLASYGLLARDGDLMAKRAFATLVVDEAQALKNAATRRAKAARALDAEFRIAMSGTPLENHVGELWSVFSVVFPGLLGSWDQFRDRFAVPIERGKDPEARAALSRLIRPFLLRRTKQEVARELPARTEVELPIALADDHLALYEDARLAAVAELTAQGKQVRDEQQRFQVLAALTRLRLLACHPRLYDATSGVTSAKLERLLELLEELRSEGHRALVFSQFTSHLAIVRTELERAGYKLLYLDGGTPAAQRAELVRQFQDGTADAFLISLKAGGTGINLTAADYVIHLDPWWNPAVEDQATDRAHRIGQTRPVTVYRLIARGTIEERILKLHAHKRSLVAGILEGTDTAARLSARDLLALLSGS